MLYNYLNTNELHHINQTRINSKFINMIMIFILFLTDCISLDQSISHRVILNEISTVLIFFKKDYKYSVIK